MPSDQYPDVRLVPSKKTLYKVKRMAAYFMDLVMASGTRFFEFSPQKIAVSVVYCARKLSRVQSEVHSSMLTEMSGVDYRSEHVLKCIETLMTLHDPNFKSKKITP